MSGPKVGVELDVPVALALAFDCLAPFLAEAGRVEVFAPTSDLAAAARQWLGEERDTAAPDGALVVLPSILPMLVRYERVGVIAAGPLWRPGRAAPSAGRLLAGQGLRAERSYALGGPSAFVWALLSRLATAGERPDLADRFEYAYRRAMAPRTGWRPAHLVALACRGAAPA